MQRVKHSILSIYPTTKLLILLLISLSVFILSNLIYPSILIVSFFIIAFFAGKGKPFTNLFFKGLMVIALMIFLLQAFFYPGEEIIWTLGPLSVKKEGVLFSLSLISKILVIGGGVVLFFQITKIKDLIHALERLGFPSKATYVILSTFQIIPEMRRLSATIMDAQRSRGVETEGNLIVRTKAFLPTLAPLILASISSTEERSITLEARAFTVKGEKTSLYQLDKTKNDTLIRILFILLFIILIGWRFVL